RYSSNLTVSPVTRTLSRDSAKGTSSLAPAVMEPRPTRGGARPSVRGPRPETPASAARGGGSVVTQVYAYPPGLQSFPAEAAIPYSSRPLPCPSGDDEAPRGKPVGPGPAAW